MSDYQPQRRPLTPRELEMLDLIAAGHSNKQIGRTLHFSEETVKSHVRHILEKLVARNRTHAVSLGYRLGLVSVLALDDPREMPVF